MLDVLDTIHDVAHSYDGGAATLARRMGKNVDTFRSEVNPKDNGHNTNIRTLLKIIDFCDSDDIARAFANDRGMICIKKTNFDDFSDKAILDLWLALQKEQGEWSQKISESLSDGKITWDELTDIRKEYNEFIVAAAEIMSRLEAYMATSEEKKHRKLTSVK